MKSSFTSALIVVLLHFFVSGNMLLLKAGSIVDEGTPLTTSTFSFTKNTPDPFVLPVPHGEKPHYSSLGRVKLPVFSSGFAQITSGSLQIVHKNFYSVTEKASLSISQYIFNCILRL